MTDKQIPRRTFLAAGSALVVTGTVAGCSDESSPATEQPTRSPEPEPETTETETTETETTETETETETETQTPTESDDEDDQTPSGSAGSGDIDREITVEMESFKLIPGSDHQGEDPIVVQKGERIELCATSLDNGIGSGHGLGIPQFGVNIGPVAKDETKCATFTADEAGEFDMLCTIQCSQPGAGGGHSNMRGTFIVEE